VRIVLDTNVILSAAWSRGGAPAQVIKALEAGRCEGVTSAALLHELGIVMRRAHVLRRLGWAAADADAFVAEHSALVTQVSPDLVLDVASDQPDNRVLEAAITGDADFIVTGDRALLALTSVRGVDIVTPAEFLRILEEQT
jgi:putative PIN family toxin of toxin-antitoxin system